MAQLQRYLTHSKIDVYFKQNKDDFVVTEVPLYKFTGEGEHLILKIRKKDMTTWDAVNEIARHVGCRSRDIGYAGLKDKNAMTIQSISLFKKYEEKLDDFNHPNIKILEKNYHNNKIKIGHLKGNKFFIRLKRVNLVDSKKIEQVLQSIVNHGMPNYYGFQRFGVEHKNYEKGKLIVEGKLKEKRRNLKQMYINSYQSYQFNLWLSKRIEISRLVDAFEPKEIYKKINLPLEEVKNMKKQEHPFKLITGDILNHYPFGKAFVIEETKEEASKFLKADRVPTGLIAGKRVSRSENLAYEIEKEFDIDTNESGSRRFAWVYPNDIQSDYKEEKNWMELSFYLPKGSYATEFIEEVIH
ncbi:MAG: tRNA pseudouridine(13) synthase TruD [Campylobacterota bacterium]